MRAHLSLNVRSLERSVEFYGRVFGVAPQKKAGGYAKFDLKAPSLNFSMHEVAPGRIPSRVNHLGVEVMSVDEVTQWQKRLAESGVETISETETECCFARQDKVWFKDPDGNSWEVFFVREQLPVTGAEPPKALGCSAGSGCC